jgi:hypothetical protein
MEFWTVLWISVLGGQLDGSTSGLLYPSLEACEAAIPAVVGTIGEAYDFSVICEETVTLSASIRPMPRPAGLAQGVTE